MALCNNNAATDESTPPDKPSITLSFPTFDFISAIVVSTNESGVQSWLHPQIETTKFFNNAEPSVVWYTSG